MEHYSFNDSWQAHPSNATEADEVNSRDKAARHAEKQTVPLWEDVCPRKMDNHGKQNNRRDLKSPQIDLRPPVDSEDDQTQCSFSEREVCANSTFNTSQQSAYSTSDNDTLNSVSSDEVHVYVNCDSDSKDVENSARKNSDTFNSEAQGHKSFEKIMASSSSQNQHGHRRFGETSPSGSSEMADGSTPDDDSSSSHDTFTRSQERVIIPKIRINGEEDSRHTNLSDQRLAGSQDVSIGTDDSYEGAIAGRSHRSSIDSGTGSFPVRQVHNHFVVVAIDFGTTYSGYAFSFSKEKEKIHIMRKWEGGDPGVINQKTLTTILLSPDEKFHSFGFTARDTFHNLKPQESKKWHYFEKFKMVLHYSTVSGYK